MTNVETGVRRAAQSLSAFAEDVRFYLSLTPRQLPSKYLYDALGSALFDAITEMPWYSLTRDELQLLRAHGAELFDRLDDLTTIVELGPGSGDKLLALLHTRPSTRRPLDVRLIDVSSSALARAVRAIGEAPAVSVMGYEDAYETGLARFRTYRGPRGRALVLFLGSNIGNFDPPGCEAFLRNLHAALLPGDALLLGTDLVKSEREFLLGYDDPLGITAAFNTNLLVRINRELGADFDVSAFVHRAIWNADRSRVEMHLASRDAQRIHIRGAAYEFGLDADETIWTESSYKYRLDDVAALLDRTGFQSTMQWTDTSSRFALTLAEAR